jgi:hypothetical protein
MSLLSCTRVAQKVMPHIFFLEAIYSECVQETSSYTVREFHTF